VDTPERTRTSEVVARQRRTNPFRENIDTRFLWLGPPHGDVFAGLRAAALDKGGLLLLTGDVGTGKTLLANAIVDSLSAEGARVATLMYTDLRPPELRSEVARVFALPMVGETRREFLARWNYFLQAARARRERILLVLDEAQDLDDELLDEVDGMARVGRTAGGEVSTISILLVSQTDADALRRWCETRGGEGRIAHRCHLGPIEPQYVGDYVAFRLRVAGADHEVFSADALQEIARASGGVPRLINRICASALLVASGRSEAAISAETVTHALNDSGRPEAPSPTGRPPRAQRGIRWIAYAAILAVAIGLGAAVYHTWNTTNVREGRRPGEEKSAPRDHGAAKGSRPAMMDGTEPSAVPELPERTPPAPVTGSGGVGTTRQPELRDRDSSVSRARRQPELPARAPSAPASRREKPTTATPPAKGSEEPDAAAVIDWFLQRRR
jgi:general secretion pathway protein A